MIGPLLIGPWLMPLAGLMPVLRIRLPLPSLAFDMPYCANAEVAHANMQKIANANLMCPRLHSGLHDRSGCPEMHSRMGGIGRALKPGSLIGPNDGIADGDRGAPFNA